MFNRGKCVICGAEDGLYGAEWPETARGEMDGPFCSRYCFQLYLLGLDGYDGHFFGFPILFGVDNLPEVN